MLGTLLLLDLQDDHFLGIVKFPNIFLMACGMLHYQLYAHIIVSAINTYKFCSQ